jgi:hypothetical protein
VGLNILSNLFELIQILEDLNSIWIIQIYLQGKKRNCTVHMGCFCWWLSLAHPSGTALHWAKNPTWNRGARVAMAHSHVGVAAARSSRRCRRRWLMRRGLGGPEQCSRLIGGGGWEGRRLTEVGCPRRRAGDQSAQRRQTGGEVAGVGGDVGEQPDTGGVLEDVAAGWFGAGGGPSVVRCPTVKDIKGGWRPREVFSPALRAEHEDGTVGDAPRHMWATTRVAWGGSWPGAVAAANRGGQRTRAGPDGEKQRVRRRWDWGVKKSAFASEPKRAVDKDARAVHVTDGAQAPGAWPVAVAHVRGQRSGGRLDGGSDWQEGPS